MDKSSRNACARPLRPTALVAAWAVLSALAVSARVVPPAGTQAPLAQAQGGAASANSLLNEAARAEAAFRFDVAADRLYQLLLEQPRTLETVEGRARLARILALQGDLPAAILQCQALGDELPADHPARRPSLDLATSLARLLRGGVTSTYFATVAFPSTRGIPSLDEPTAIGFDPSGAWLLVDAGAGRAYRAAGDAATALGAAGDELAAAAFLAGGSIAVAGRNGITRPGARPALFTGAWGGRIREVKKVRALAAIASGDLLVVDRDYDGVLRCANGGTSCVPWGPPGKVRTVKVGASDLVYLLDDRQQSVRVADPSGRLLATIGPALGNTKLGEVVDIAVDSAYGVFLLDKAARRIHVAALRIGPDGRIAPVLLGGVTVPAEGERALKNPSAIGVAPDGWLLVAGRSAPRLLRFD